jgi:GH25 family lysozyme M1 (1,4-beta-N-acetylmuramidase)
MVKIIDTSHHKGYIDWQQVKNYGIEGVIQKCSDGWFMPDDMNKASYTQHIDPSFRLYWKSLEDMFSWRGAYHFLRVDDELAIENERPTSLEQVDVFYEAMVEEGLNYDDYVILDIEEPPSNISYLSPSTIADRVTAVIQKTTELFKRKPILYTGAWWWDYYKDYFDHSFVQDQLFWMSHYWAIDHSTNEFLNQSPKYYIREERLFPHAWLDDLNDRIAYCRVPVIRRSTGEEISAINKNKAVMWQYSSSGNIPGIHDGKGWVDISIAIRPEETWTEARAEEPEPPTGGEMGVLEDIRAELEKHTTLLEEISGKLEGGGGTDPGNGGGTPEPTTVGVRVDRGGKQVYTFCVGAYNAKNKLELEDGIVVLARDPRGFPVFVIYPSNTSEVGERVFVESMSVVQVYPEAVLGDGGWKAYRIDKSQLVPKTGSASIPTVDGDGNEIELFIREDFVVEFV